MIFTHLGRVLLAYLLALPVAWDREREARGAGLRTFPLVATASCGFILITETVMPGDKAAASRILQGLMTGIGFIGGGAILKQGSTVEGTASAASIWNTGAIGAAVAYARYDIAIILGLVNFATLRILTRFKKGGPNGQPKQED